MNTALVLAGGGAKGSAQAECLAHLRTLGLTLDVQLIAGVSVGALNGAMVANDQLDELQAIWTRTRAEDVYDAPNLFQKLAVLTGSRRHWHDTAPLARLIQRHYDPRRCQIPFLAGTVDLLSGEYLRWQLLPEVAPRLDATGVQRYREVILASSSIPVIFPPQTVGDQAFMVDGGVRNIAPLADVIESDADRIVVITTEPTQRPSRAGRPDHILDVIQRTFELLLSEVIRNDVARCRRINEAVRAGHDSRHRHVPCYLAEPGQRLGSALDFSRDALARRRAEGRAMAERLARDLDANPDRPVV